MRIKEEIFGEVTYWNSLEEIIEEYDEEYNLKEKMVQNLEEVQKIFEEEYEGLECKKFTLIEKYEVEYTSYDGSEYQVYFDDRRDAVDFFQDKKYESIWANKRDDFEEYIKEEDTAKIVQLNLWNENEQYDVLDTFEANRKAILKGKEIEEGINKEVERVEKIGLKFNLKDLHDFLADEGFELCSCNEKAGVDEAVEKIKEYPTIKYYDNSFIVRINLSSVKENFNEFEKIKIIEIEVEELD